MLKMVPVCGGGSDLKVLESTCGRAGLRLRLMIFLTFFSGGAAMVESEARVRSVVVAASLLSVGRVVSGTATTCTSVMIYVVIFVIWLIW